MQECYLPFSVSLALPKNSINTKMFSRKIQMLVEAGIINKWFDEEFEKVARINSKSTVAIASNNPLSIDNLQGPFLVLFMFLGSASITFIIEKMIPI